MNEQERDRLLMEAGAHLAKAIAALEAARRPGLDFDAVTFALRDRAFALANDILKQRQLACATSSRVTEPV